jgi:hypothetical protein
MDRRNGRAAIGVALVALGLVAAPAHAGAPGVTVGSLSSLKASAGTLHGTVINETDRGRSAEVVVRLHRHGTQARVVGRTTVKVPARTTLAYRVAAKLPSGLRRGTYYLSACTPSGAGAGLYGCATAADEITVGKLARRTATAAQTAECSAGGRTLAKPGSRVYPETGNTGYTSVHTDVVINYDAPSNQFLPGTYVDLQQKATQCLTEFSLDFERSNTVTSTTVPGPNFTVQSVTIDGQPATFTFKQPTFPGNPKGQDDTDPAAHAASLSNPVNATNPNPPACTPISSSAAQQGVQCPANKLVITPSAPIAAGSDFVVRVNYTGRPGVHVDGDGSTEGWFRNNTPAGDGGFVTTEPLGTMAWMPLNNHPTVKPTYDFYDTINYDAASTRGNRVTLGNGRLVSTTINAPDANFATGSRTFHWRSPEPIASYLVENSMGYYDLNERLSPSGVVYYEAQSSDIPAATKANNKAIMDQQEDITLFQERFNGPWPFSSNGVIVGIPTAGFEEEMQTKITFQRSRINLGVFHHENMHQWWGDNVSEDRYERTFFKEGYADMSESYAEARADAVAAGGLGTPAGDAAFEARLVANFNSVYNSTSASASGWNVAPSNPTSANLFGNQTYVRAGAAYLALRAIMGKAAFDGASKEIQARFGGASITQPQQIAVYKQWMPKQTAGCLTKLDAFFKQWWDTAYSGSPAAGNKPQITGPGLAGPGFYDASGGCAPYGTDAPGDAGGTVPATLALTLGAGATFEPFVPGVEKTYVASTTANVISTAGDAALTYSDPGHLTNGPFALAQPLQVTLSKAAWSAPVSNDAVAITFTQPVGARDPLRTGTYSKTLTFTLSTTTP